MIIIVYCFASHSRIFHLYREVIIADTGLQNFGLYRVTNNFKTSGAMWAPHFQLNVESSNKKKKCNMDIQ